MKPTTEQWFELPAYQYCGLLFKKNIMVKALRLQHEYETKLQQLFHSHIDEIESCGWTMDSTEDNQTSIYCRYIDAFYSKQSRINLFKMVHPKVVENMLLTTDRDIAKRWCNRKLIERRKADENTDSI